MVAWLPVPAAGRAWPADRDGETAASVPATGRLVIRIGLADDQVLVRTGFAALLDAEDDMEIAGQAANGAEAVRLAASQRPDVLLMDIRMPVLDGIEATRQIAARPDLAGVHVVILTTFELDEYIFDALRAGAAGFLVKDTDAVEFIRAVRVVAAGDSLLSPAVTRRLIAEFTGKTWRRGYIRGSRTSPRGNGRS